MVLGDGPTVSAKFNRTRVQTAPVTLLRIVQPREWCHWKELGILLQKHPLDVKIDHFRPEKIEFKDKKLKLKMYVFRTRKITSIFEMAITPSKIALGIILR